ncbi:hypothetical protein [Candidatus Palauibacter sp.]|uniref:hypothetical protein n=1 Tax=Candidatus Palauibacter sp. TaxID=3101350 RepID=UPI003CC6CE28
MIATHNGFGDVPAVRVDEYSAVRRHLDQFYNKLEKRYDKGSTPYNLRSCAYHAEFSKSKVFWMDMSPRGRFAYSDEEVYCNDKAYFMTGRSLKWCCAILNSHRGRTKRCVKREATYLSADRLPAIRGETRRKDVASWATIHGSGSRGQRGRRWRRGCGSRCAA